MPKYHFKNEVNGYESDYESDEGTLYHAKEVIGAGSYTRARIFQAENERKVVLAPKTPQLIGG
ncbi:hypothetical protein [Legionella tunisiensis]|uniref:hypothetical protein n=1 Tax=Legionella tunisiensis TaxID=1034944 RepID=UPI0002EF9B76|nr:hypothetical protein [Legionella tunisiensis]